MKSEDKIKYLNELMKTGFFSAADALDILAMKTPNGVSNPGYIGIDFSVSVHYIVGDKVRITEQLDANWGMVGEIIRVDELDNSFLIEFEFDSPFGKGKNSDWYYGTGEFVHANKPTYAHQAPVEFSCKHVWKVDYKSIFVNKEYHSCSKCGKKKEDV